ALDGTHHLQLVEAHVPTIGITPRRTVLAEDIRELQVRAHEAKPLCRSTVLLLWLRQMFQRALDLRDHAGRDARVARRRLQFVVAEQRLDQTNVRASLPEMRRERVAQGMQRHAGLSDAGGVNALAEQSAELACGAGLAA